MTFPPFKKFTLMEQTGSTASSGTIIIEKAQNGQIIVDKDLAVYIPERFYVALRSHFLGEQWVDVKDRLPEFIESESKSGNKCSKEVLFMDNEGDCFLGWVEAVRSDTDIYWNNQQDVIINNVTHWQHLPAPPQDKG